MLFCASLFWDTLTVSCRLHTEPCQGVESLHTSTEPPATSQGVDVLSPALCAKEEAGSMQRGSVYTGRPVHVNGRAPAVDSGKWGSFLEQWWRLGGMTMWPCSYRRRFRKLKPARSVLLLNLRKINMLDCNGSFLLVERIISHPGTWIWKTPSVPFNNNLIT